jgi:hypothetical protein
VGAGFEIAVLAFRSCDGRMNLGRRLYHSGETGDLDWVVRRLIAQRPGRALYLHGVSLGGNVLLKWLGQQGDGAPTEVRGAAATSPPFDLLVSGPVLDRALFGVYRRRFLRTLLPKARLVAERFPGSLDPRRLRTVRTIEAFDEWATAPLHGFAGAHDYWRRVSSRHFLPSVAHPAGRGARRSVQSGVDLAARDRRRPTLPGGAVSGARRSRRLRLWMAVAPAVLGRGTGGAIFRAPASRGLGRGCLRVSRSPAATRPQAAGAARRRACPRRRSLPP